MPAHLLFGDSFLVTHALRELQEQVGPPEVIEANTHRVSGSGADPAQLRGLCSSVPFLADYRLVVVDGLLSMSESRGGRRRPAAASSRDSASEPGRGDVARWESMPSYITTEMPPTTLLVFLEGRLSRANSLAGKLRPALQVRELPTPAGEGLSRWIKVRAEEKGAQITPGAIRLLSQLVGGNLWTLDNELEKLSLHAVDRAISEGDVSALVSQAREASIFAAVDAILDGRSAIALQSVHRLRDEGAEFSYIVVMVARQLRLVTQAKDLIERRHPEKEVGQRLGINQDFVLRRTLGQARKRSWSSLEWLYKRLLEADLAVKQGRSGEDIALELLVSEATSLAAVPGASPRGGRAARPG